MKEIIPKDVANARCSITCKKAFERRKPGKEAAKLT